MLKKLRTSVSLVCKGGDNFGWLMNATSEEMSLDSVRRKLSKYWYLENFLLFAAPLISIGGDMEGRLMNIKLSGTLKVLFWYLTNFFKILHQPNVNGRKVLTRVVGWWTLCAKSSGKWLSWQRTPTLSENQYNREKRKGKGNKYLQQINKYIIKVACCWYGLRVLFKANKSWNMLFLLRVFLTRQIYQNQDVYRGQFVEMSMGMIVTLLTNPDNHNLTCVFLNSKFKSFSPRSCTTKTSSGIEDDR